MKIQKRLAAILTAAFILSGSIPMPALKADQPPDELITEQDNTVAYNENTADETQTSESETDIEEDSNKSSPSDSEAKIDEDTEDEENTVKTSPSSSTTDIEEDSDESSPSDSEGEIDKDSEDEENTVKALQSASMPDIDEDLDESSPSESEEDSAHEEDTVKASQSESETEITEGTEGEDETEYPVPDEPPEFHAHIERKPLGYIVKGTFTEFTPDITHIYPMYSLNGENWQRVDDEYEWDLTLLEYLGTGNENDLHELQNQMLGLEDMREPLKSYVTGEIDCIYIKMHIIKQNGCSYDSKSAVIEQTLLPIPDNTTYSARFFSTVVVREWNPNTRRNREYGRYQLTVSADTKTEDIYALLPDTLPIQVELQNPREIVPYASAVVNCPVTWKSLSLPSLSAGESITITDATEKIQIPAGTQIRTPLGIFRLDKPLSVDTDRSISCDYYNEVELVVNVSTETSNPTGVLKEAGGLKISLHKKATGATSIKTYILIEGESEWTELTGLSLLKELSLQSSTANGGYALVLRSDQEPYQSYLESKEAGKTSKPFFIGLEFEGGIYDGKQLILAWPDTYEVLPDLPNFNGISGNEDNAGANNNHDSTENGQRPNLPQTPDDEQKEQQPNLSQSPSEEPEQQQPNQSQTPGEEPEQQQPNQSQTPGEEPEQQQPNQSQTPGEEPEQQQPNQFQTSGEGEKEQQTSLSQTTDEGEKEQQPNPNLSSDDNRLNQPVPTQTPETVPAIPENQNTLSLEEGENALFIQQLDSDPQKPEITESGQRPNLPQIAQNTVDTPDAEESTTDTGQKDSLIVELFDNPVQSPIKVQAAIEKKDTEIAIEHTTENDSHIPLLPVTITVTAGICIGAAVCKTAGYDLFYRIVGKIRNVLHK